MWVGKVGRCVSYLDEIARADLKLPHLVVNRHDKSYMTFYATAPCLLLAISNLANLINHESIIIPIVFDYLLPNPLDHKHPKAVNPVTTKVAPKAVICPTLIGSNACPAADFWVVVAVEAEVLIEVVVVAIPIIAVGDTVAVAA